MSKANLPLLGDTADEFYGLSSLLFGWGVEVSYKSCKINDNERQEWYTPVQRLNVGFDDI